MQRLEPVAERLFQDTIAGNTAVQIFMMKRRGGWRDPPDPNQVTVNVLWGARTLTAKALELAGAMTSEERRNTSPSRRGRSHG